MEFNLENINILQDRVTPSMVESRKMYNGNLWLDGAGLVINKPSNDAAKIQEMKDGFATQNVIEEVVDRKRDGILGREPMFQILTKPQKDLTEQEKTTINEMSAAIVAWWNNREILSLIKDCFVNALIDRRAEVRPFLPRTAYDKNGGLKSVKTISDALELLRFEVVSPTAAAVFLEEDSLKPYSVYQYTKKDERIIEISLTDEDGFTHLAKIKEKDYSTFAQKEFPTLAKYIVNKEAANETAQYSPLDLGGKLYLFELDLKRAFISDPMKSLQKQISLDKTMQGRNTYTAGFRSKHWLNARPPTTTKQIADSNEASGFRKETVNLPMKNGAGITSFVQGSVIRNNSGEIIGTANPQVVITDPVSVSTFIESKADNRAGILAMANQIHVLINDSAAASGFSRQQARAEFQKSLMDVKAPIDALGRWVIEFAIMFAANLINRVEEFKQFRCDFNSIVDAGVLSAEEKEDNRKAYSAGEISLETLQSRNGVEDTDAELVKIKSEDGFEINRLDKVLTVLEKANGKLPLKMQIEFLVKSLGKEKDWNVDEILAEIDRELPKVGEKAIID